MGRNVNGFTHLSSGNDGDGGVHIHMKYAHAAMEFTNIRSRIELAIIVDISYMSVGICNREWERDSETQREREREHKYRLTVILVAIQAKNGFNNKIAATIAKKKEETFQ